MISKRPYRIQCWLFGLVMIICCSSFTSGQEQSQFDKGTPPQHASGLSSLGSYTSMDLGTVNLSNGSLNFKIPLATIGGRGFSIPLTLNYSSKVWSASMDTAYDRNNEPFQAAYADYANLDNFVDYFDRLAPGWTIGATPMIFNRIVRINQLPSQTPPNSLPTGCYTYTVPKLSVMLPDKGEIEFRDDLYDGKPLPSNCSGTESVSRGKRWHATDGSGTIYISDQDNAGAQMFGDLSGEVITSDGTRYRFNGPRCVYITDRNGNRININYTDFPTKIEYVDQLGRITKIERFVPDPADPGVTLAALVTIPGYDGNRYLKLKRATMSANYRSDISAPGQVCTGIYDPRSIGFSTWCGSNPTILFPHSYGAFMQRLDDQQVFTELVLPDSRSLRFKYNLFGEVAEAQLPTGGKIWFDYEEGTVPAGNSNAWEIGGDYHTEVGEVDRTLIQRRVFDGSELLATWDYFYTTTDVFVAATSPTEGVLLNERHSFLQSGRYTDYLGGAGDHDGTYYTLWSTGIEWRTEMRTADGTVVLSANEKDWTQRAAVSWPGGYPQEQPANDNRVNQERRYLENSMMSKIDTLYDQYNNPIETKEYDYDQTLKRRTVTSYLSVNNNYNYQTDDAIHILSLPESQIIYDGSGNQKAKTVTEYDVYTNDQNHDLMTSYGSVSQHDANYGTGKTTRGNPTRVGNWLNTTGDFIYTYPRYDIVGNVVATKDSRGYVSTTVFADDFGDGSNPGSPTQNPATPTYACPTMMTSPPPVPGEPAHVAHAQFNYATSLLTGFRDRNNVVIQTIYADPFNRPTLVKSALGINGIESHARTYYAPGATPFGITLARNDTLTAKDQTSLDDAVIRSWTVTDGFGRTKESWSRDPDGDLKVVTTYDALNREKQVSNPFRPTLQSPIYTTSTYDMLGRVTTITGVDGSVVTSLYEGNTLTVTDQTSRKRMSVTDALGRLKEVREAPDVAGFNYVTTYDYDTLDNLTSVTQGTQTRSFVYNSLKQLTSANNPESGITEYQYDEAGNLVVKKDARGVYTHYTYDAFNRITRRWYNGSGLTSDTTNNSPALPTDVGTSNEANFYYDVQSLPAGAPTPFTRGASNGRLVAVTYGTDSSSGDYAGYDAAGRNIVKIQQTGGVNYQLTAVRNITGAPTSVSYPSGHSVAYTYNVAGQTLTMSGNLGDGTSRNYSSDLKYSSFGRISKEKFGTDNAVYHKVHYNIRGQIYDVRASSVDDEWDGDLGALVNFYSAPPVAGTSGPDNNGNVTMSQTLINGFKVEDRYTYDAVNRLKSVEEYQNGTTKTGTQIYDYDQWGNRTINSSSTGVGINTTSFEKQDSTNRLYAPGDLAQLDSLRQVRYDLAGNQIKDSYTGAGNRTFDAENKITSAWGGNNQAQLYSYDANGQRVRQTVNGVEEWHVYGFGGELVAEYPVNGATSNPKREYGYRGSDLLVTTESVSAGAGPAGLTATPPSSGANITLNWSAVSGATNYRVERKAAGGSFTLVGTTSATTLIDSGTTSGNAYLFRVCVANGVGQCTSAFSNIALGTAITFVSDPTIISMVDDPTGVTVTSMKAAHINELRAAVSAVRTLAGLPGPSWTYPVIGVGSFIHVEDMRELRTQLDEALTALGIQTSSYTDPTLKGIFEDPLNATLIRAVHIRELRDRVRSGVGGSGGGGVSSFKINWLITDHLGSARMSIDKTGNLGDIKRHDYLPFGEELFANVGGRQSSDGYSTSGTNDGQKQKFTGKERDVETGLDNFGARYYSSAQGRFNSPDPLLSSGRPQQPQSWNRYSYVINEPLTLIDPNGLDWGYVDYVDSNGTQTRRYHYFEGEGVGEFEGRTYTAVNFGGDQTRTLDLSDGRNVQITNDPTLFGRYMRDVTPHARVNLEYVLPPSWMDHVPVVSEGRQFLFHFTTHQFERALLDFGQMAVELGTAVPSGSALAARTFATKSGEAIFYSGEGAYTLASEAAKTEGGKLLQNTLGGKFLNIITKPMSNKMADPFWRWGSKHFAEGASGTVRAFIREPTRNFTTWRQVEFPILRVTPFVKIVAR